ncbi:MAG: shikimate kinase [Saprospiraceae bacterium]|nr:shikimate kinase [Saprospiraceae bacterium]MBK8825271.1 shikimate kinase [Saprospiraceae bacterium]HQV96970.1 shikimate kinase [Saprospiraceae bacterium]
MTIFLIGMPCSGKSTLGLQLAEHLQMPFFDTDAIIEDMEGIKVSDIFTRHGEARFRDLEHELMANWKLSHVVVATGGGLPCHNDLIDILNSKGKTIWLQASIDALSERLSQSEVIRPLTDGKSDKETKSKLKELLKNRKPIYSKAQIRVKVESDSEVTLRKILRKLYT